MIVCDRVLRLTKSSRSWWLPNESTNLVWLLWLVTCIFLNFWNLSFIFIWKVASRTEIPFWFFLPPAVILSVRSLPFQKTFRRQVKYCSHFSSGILFFRINRAPIFQNLQLSAGKFHCCYSWGYLLLYFSASVSAKLFCTCSKVLQLWEPQ